MKNPNPGPERCIWHFNWSILYCSLKPQKKCLSRKGGCQQTLLRKGEKDVPNFTTTGLRISSPEWKMHDKWVSTAIGKTVMVWSCISASGVGCLVKICGIINIEKHNEILTHCAVQSGKRLIDNCLILQHEKSSGVTDYGSSVIDTHVGLFYICSFIALVFLICLTIS